MPSFRIVVERVYRLQEEATLWINADTPTDALRRLRKMEEAGDLEDRWIEVDGGPDEGSYIWSVYDNDDSRNGVLLEEAGAAAAE